MRAKNYIWNLQEHGKGYWYCHFVLVLLEQKSVGLLCVEYVCCTFQPCSWHYWCRVLGETWQHSSCSSNFQTLVLTNKTRNVVKNWCVCIFYIFIYFLNPFLSVEPVVLLPFGSCLTKTPLTFNYFKSPYHWLGTAAGDRPQHIPSGMDCGILTPLPPAFSV